MADYSKATNFTAKDTLPTGNAGKIVKGTEIDTELTAVSNAIASKANINSPGLTGTPTAPTASTGTNTTQLATTAFVTAALSAIYPVGSIYINATSSTNPATLLGFGTWTAFGAGRVMVGLDGSDALFDTAEETGGSKDAIVVSHTHTGTTNGQSVTHNHGTTFNRTSKSGNNTSFMLSDPSTGENLDGQATVTSGDNSVDHNHSFTTGSTGSSATNANVQPFIVVRMWKRTA